MSIFEIIGLSLLIAILVALVYIFIVGCCTNFDLDDASDWVFKLMVVMPIITWVVGIFAGIAINTECERIYVARYKVQKETIETSLHSDALSGMERIELVNKAVELNGELAEKKTRFDMWHYVYFDNSLYDDIDFIEFKEKEK